MIKIAKLEIKQLPTRKKIIPLVMAIANTIIKELRFVEIINETVKWDRPHWNISPGGLLKMFVMCTFTDIRTPLTHLGERLDNIDTDFFLDSADKSSYVNESNVGEALERLGKTDCEGLYEKTALSAMRQYDVPINRMHSDTTTISFYGEYDPEKMDLTDEEKESLPRIERGYNKDGRPGSKQAVVGQITNEHGMPLTNRVLDGAASDVEWNRIALEHVSDIYSSGFRSGIYVADCKLVTEEHVAAMNDPGRHVRFVSRCPANFHDSLERRTIKEAYEAGQWDEIGPVSEAKGAAQYKSAPLTAEVCGTPMRLLVLESSELKRKAELALRQKEEALAPVMKAFEKKQWACLPDAEAERGRVLGLKQLSLFDCDIRIDECTTEKWPRGRRGKNTKPSIVTTYRLRAESTSRNAPGCREFLQNESCFVLISNAAGDVSDEDLLKTYKGQQVVENSFRELKSPHLASVIYLKNPTRITAVSMLLTFSLLVRALIQYRLREGLKTFNEKHPDIKICAGWGGRRLKNPTFKLLYEHSVNCVFERESQGEYSFSWPSSETRAKIEPLLKLMGLSLARLVE